MARPRLDAEIIADAVRDSTIGEGEAAEDPGDEDYDYVAYMLKRPLTDADRSVVQQHWRACLQMMDQP